MTHICTQWTMWGISINTDAASGVIASSCAGSSAAAASYWCVVSKITACAIV